MSAIADVNSYFRAKEVKKNNEMSAIADFVIGHAGEFVKKNNEMSAIADPKKQEKCIIS